MASTWDEMDASRCQWHSGISTPSFVKVVSHVMLPVKKTPQAKAKFQQLHEAYQVLGDETLRKKSEWGWFVAQHC